jgi:transposase-like protein
MVNNLKDVFKKFNTEEKCRDFLIKQRWNGVPTCPYCGCTKSYNIENGKRFKCANNQCYKKYTVTIGTVMEASNIPLTTWLPAMYIITAHKKGISSVQLAKDLGVTQKTAWFMLHRIRESLKESYPQMLSGIVEADETYMGRKFRSEYKGLPPEKVYDKRSDRTQRMGTIVGLMAREQDKIIVKAVNQPNSENVKPILKQHIKPQSILFTDEAYIYRSGLDEYYHQTVNHYKREWTRGMIHTNNVEAFWSVMKRGVYGIYHQISYKHLQRYCDEFSYRYNSRKLKDGERFIFALQNIEGRLSYKRLVHGKGKENTQEQA